MSSAKQAAPPTNRNRPSRKRPRWQRAGITATTAALILAAGAVVQAALSIAAPQLLDRLPGWLSTLWGWSFWAKALFILSCGMLVYCVAWLILANRQEGKIEEATQAEQARAEHGKLLDEHVALPITAAIGGLAEELRHPLPATLANISAPSGLPRAVAFTGRAQTLTDLLADLRKGGAVGVFALAGMGGVGKTALAAEAVAQLSADAQIFPAGAAWIVCEDLHGPEGLSEVWNRVARSLDALEVAALPDVEQRRAALHALLARGGRRLLALDNVDDLEVAPLLATLAVQGHTTLLLTARHAIDLPGLTTCALDVLTADEAEALFKQTLTRNSRVPRHTSADETVLPGLAASLGGLPLAIELTASYAGRQGLALSTVQQEIIQDGVVAAPFLPAQHPQQRALVLRFDRSWQALAETPRRQRLFAALSLLKGNSFPREAAVALALAAGGKRATPANAAGDLMSLVNYMLVEALSGERLRLHPLLRYYAGKRLANLPAKQAERLGEAMCTFWREYGEAHSDYAGLKALAADVPGLLGALEWAHEHARYREVLGLAPVLNSFLLGSWRLDEVRLVLLWALEAAQALKDKQEWWAVFQLAVLDEIQGRLSEARAGYEQARELARQFGNTSREGLALNGLMSLAAEQGRLSEARAGYEQALELALQSGDLAGERRARYSLAYLDDRQGRLSEARAGYEQALELARQLVDTVGESLALQELGDMDAKQEQFTEARASYEQALELARQSDDKGSEWEVLHRLAWLDERTGRLEEARSCYQRALILAQQSGGPKAISNILDSFGLFLSKHGEVESGRAKLEQSLAIRERLADVETIGQSHQSLASIEENLGNPAAAIAHYREALRCFEQMQSSQVGKMRDALRRLGEQA